MRSLFRPRNADAAQAEHDAMNEGGGNDHDIGMLVDMGFESDQAVQALRDCGGDLTQAIALLLNFHTDGEQNIAGVDFVEEEQQRQSDPAQEASPQDLEDLEAALNEAIRISEQEEQERRQRNDDDDQLDLSREEKELQEILEVSKNEHKMQEFERQRKLMSEQADMETVLLRSQREGLGDATTGPEGEAQPHAARRTSTQRLAPLDSSSNNAGGSAGLGMNASTAGTSRAEGGSKSTPAARASQGASANRAPTSSRPGSRGGALRSAAAMSLSIS
jgi:hypothetical protein